MVAQRTTQAYQALLTYLNLQNGGIAPRQLQAYLIGQTFSRTDIQRALQLALSNGDIKLDGALKFEATQRQAA